MNNRQDFERFAVQYWGQNVGVIKEDHLYQSDLYTVSVLWITKIECLSLRSIESLTDEECKVLFFELFGKPHGPVIAPLITAIQYFKMDCFDRRQLDYLRYIGILVPFDKYSVEEILSIGWAVIKK